MARQPVYSTLFIAANGVDVDAMYVVPAGSLAVVRDITAWAGDEPEDTALVVADYGTGTYCWYAIQTAVAQYWHQDLRQIFPEGATITAQSSGPNPVTMRVSGYLLALP